MKPKPIIFITQRQQSREATLLAAGYVRRTAVGEPRLSELVTEYERIGFEVEVIEHRTEGDVCGICYEADAQAGEVYGDIYIRTRHGSGVREHTTQTAEATSSSDQVALISRP